MKSQLSIIVPVRNRASLVERTLNSIVASKHRPFQLIVVDNGSTDNTLEVCRVWAEKSMEADLSIHVLSEPQAGASIARNAGLRMCQTDWVYFFDSDDLMTDDFVGCIMEYIKEQGNDLDMIVIPVRMTAEGKLRIKDFEPTGRAEAHLLNNMMCTASMVFRTSWLQNLGGWNEQLTTWDDWELGARVLLARPRLQWFPEHAFHQIIIHAESQTGESFAQKLPPILTAMNVVLRDIMEMTDASDGVRQRCLRALYLRSMIMAGKLQKEGSREGECAFRKITGEIIPHANKPLKMIGMLLKYYSAAGGRGAWRLALGLV